MELILLQASDFNFGTAIVALGFVIAISIGIFLLFRELILWYWKVNRIIENQEAQSVLLKQVIDAIKKNEEVRLP